jgi:hypothetical protein
MGCKHIQHPGGGKKFIRKTMLVPITKEMVNIGLD